MLTKFIKLKSFKEKKFNKHLRKNLKKILSNKSELIKSLSKKYEDKYNFPKIRNLVGKNDLYQLTPFVNFFLIIIPKEIYE